MTDQMTSPPPVSLRGNRPFALLAGVQGLRAVAFWLSWLGMLSLASYTLRAPAGRVALTLAFGAAAFIVVSPFAGILIDRTNAKWALAGALAAGAVNALWLSTATSMAHVYASHFVAAGLAAVVWPALGALVKGLVDEPALVRANAVLAGVWEATLVGGPLLASLLSSAIGPRAPIVVSAIVYAAASLTVLPLRFVPAHRIHPAGDAPGLGAIRDGFRLVLGRDDLRALVGWGSVAVGALFVLVGIEPAFVRESLGGGQATLSLVYAIGGIGATAGAFAVGWLSAAGRELVTAAIALAVVGVSFAVYIWWARWPEVAPTAVLAGGGFAAYVTVSQALVQRRSSAMMVGRATAARRTIDEMVSFAASAGGSLAAATAGVRPTMMVAATVMTVAGVGLLVRAVRLDRGAAVPAAPRWEVHAVSHHAVEAEA